MKHIIIAGAGKIGCLIALHLAKTNEYHVTMMDKEFGQADSKRLQNEKSIICEKIDINDDSEVDALIIKSKAIAIISCLPYFCNIKIVEYAIKHKLHYFDLTEDVEIANQIKKLSKNSKQAFMPRCGLAPGFIGLVAHSLSHMFDKLGSVKLRVGALPINSNNALQYALTWSTDGLINEYANASEVIRKGKVVSIPALEGLETIKIDGITYEAFHTSGGLGNLATILKAEVDNLSYKTIRYPGHCSKIKFLMNDLLLEQNRDTLKQILENAIPKTYQDVVIIYVSITGIQDGKLLENNYVNKLYPQSFYGYEWSAMQVTTASSVAAVVDLVLEDQDKYQGYACQENLDFQQFVNNRFGQIFKKDE